MSNQLTWDIVCGGIKLTVTMNTDIDYTLKDRILLTYNIDCDLQTDINTINISNISNITFFNIFIFCSYGMYSFMSSPRY